MIAIIATRLWEDTPESRGSRGLDFGFAFGFLPCLALDFFTVRRAMLYS
jgi:hypothetical protein